MPEIVLKYTKHAAEMKLERGVSDSEIRKAIRQGARVKQRDGMLAVYGDIMVAYVKESKNVYRIKTIMIR